MLPEEELSEIAAQYKYDPQGGQYISCGPQIQITKFGSEYESGGGRCISTVDDYIAFLEALREYRLLKPETIARMTSPQISLASERGHGEFSVIKITHTAWESVVRVPEEQPKIMVGPVQPVLIWLFVRIMK